jgi:predicted transposase YbfD/YdcC
MFVDLPNGIPSHDTLSDVLGRINPEQFAQLFTQWVEAALPTLAGEHVAIDGKTLRGSGLGGEGKLHLMSAFASRARFVLTQRAVREKTNEITAIPELLSLLDVRGATITIDAIGCQRAIAAQLTDAGADYVLALKENQPALHSDVKLFLDTEIGTGSLPVLATLDKDHGRVEKRRYWLSDKLDWLPARSAWKGLAGLGVVEAVRESGGKVSTERRYFLSSFTDLGRFAQTVRAHWSIENSQHWVLDVQFGEDANRARKDHSATNLALIRRMSLNLLRRNGSDKRSLRRRKLLASLNDDYRTKFLFGEEATT